MLALRVGTSPKAEAPDAPAAAPLHVVPDPDPTPAQRRRLKQLLEDGARTLRHRLRMVENGAECVDPESALESVRSIERECRRILAAANQVTEGR